MALIDEYLKENINLSTKVADYSEFLNQNSDILNNLIQQLEFLFTLFCRSETLIKIIRDYSTNFKNEVCNFKKVFSQQEKTISEASSQLINISKVLKIMDERLIAIQTNANLFVGSTQALTHLAKNTEIRAYKAKQEGKGLAIIAKESLALANLAQLPYQDFYILLNNLKETAKPVITELDKVIEVSLHSAALLSRGFVSLKTIDETIESLQKIITVIEKHNFTYGELRKNVSNELNVLKEQLLISLNIIDDTSTRCTEINSLAQLLTTLHNILNSAQEPANKSYILRQFNYLLTENIRVLGKFPRGKKPPLFPYKIYLNIGNITRQITELSLSIDELTNYTENLGAGMNNIIDLEAQMESFFTNTQNTLENLNKLGTALNSELGKIEELVTTTGKIFSRIKTLSIFARIEESRSVHAHDIISPVVVEFSHLTLATEKPFLSIESKIVQLKKDAQTLCQQRIAQDYLKTVIPDYSKTKIFFDDIVRVFGEKKKSVSEISKTTEELNRNNTKLKELWQGYEDSITRVLKVSSSFEKVLKEEIGAPVVFKEKTIVNAHLSDEPLTLKPDLKTDANSHHIISNISVGLFQFGDGADVIPGLCEDYSISPSGTEYTFRIKQDIKYHNGQSLGIEDIKRGMERALAGPNFNFFEMIVGAKEFLKTKEEKTLNIKIINNQTLQIRLEYPFLPILANLSANIADPYIDGDFPSGIGPFKIVAWEKRKRLVLEANDLYFEGRPAIDEFHFLIINNDNEAYELFKKGMLSIYRPSGESLEKIKKKTPGLLYTVPELSVQYLCINCQKSPFNNKLVRKAIVHAIDIEKLVRDFLAGNDIPAKGIFPPSMKVYNRKLESYRYNPQKSKDLLKEAGFKNGVPGSYYLDISDSPSVIRRAEFIKSSLNDIGIKIELNPIPWHSLLEKTYKGNSTLSFQGWVSDNGDPDNFLYPLFHSNSFGYPGNTFFFSTPEIDRDIENARKIRNIHQRINFYRKIEQEILDEAPGVFMFHSLENIAVQKEILGLKPHPLSLIRAKYVCPVTKDNKKGQSEEL